MIPTVTVTAAFPVPTPANPSAFFTKEKLVELNETDEAKPLSRTSEVRQELAKARADLRSKVGEDYRRKQDFDLCKRKWRSSDAAKAKEEKLKELEALGLPESCGYMLDTAQFAMKQYRESEPAASASAPKDSDAVAYDHAVKRLASDTSMSGAEKLQKDLQQRADRNAKRAKVARDTGEGVNAANAQFLRAVEKNTNKDARTQIIRQNLERGTAL
ncbi:MAG TPA: hypothetical protein VEF04_20280 [Blastocatellia bacterium]|nr:hypothetical protein [Blastocatellia bacterium]